MQPGAIASPAAGSQLSLQPLAASFLQNWHAHVGSHFVRKHTSKHLRFSSVLALFDLQSVRQVAECFFLQSPQKEGASSGAALAMAGKISPAIKLKAKKLHVVKRQECRIFLIELVLTCILPQ